jgi:DNA modification methylase
VATDPPYLVDYTGERLGSGKDWTQVYDEKAMGDPEEFFTDVFSRVLDVLAPHAAVYCWHAFKRYPLLQSVWRKLGLLDHQQVIWVKPVAVVGRSLYHWQHEPCLVGWREGSMPKLDRKEVTSSVVVINAGMVHGSEAADVWIQDWEGRKRPAGNEHPTQKPVELFARPMRKHTKEGAICFEPFSGSGSQLIAAEQLKRRVRAMELEPVFVDVAVRRWQAFTGQAATLAGDGRTWDEIASARRRRTKACPPSPDAPVPTQDAHRSPKAATAKRTSEKAPSGRPGRRRKDRPQAAATDRSGESSALESSPAIPSARSVEQRRRRASTTSGPRPKAAAKGKRTSEGSAGPATIARAQGKGPKAKRPGA